MRCECHGTLIYYLILNFLYTVTTQLSFSAVFLLSVLARYQSVMVAKKFFCAYPPPPPPKKNHTEKKTRSIAWIFFYQWNRNKTKTRLKLFLPFSSSIIYIFFLLIFIVFKLDFSEKYYPSKSSNSLPLAIPSFTIFSGTERVKQPWKKPQFSHSAVATLVASLQELVRLPNGQPSYMNQPIKILIPEDNNSPIVK